MVAQLVPAVRSLISADLVLLVLVPGLVFDAALDLDWRALRSVGAPLVGLAVPGVLVSAAIVALALSALVGLPLGLSFVIGAITAATDPVAVIATLTRLDMPRRLRTLVEGESLMNDGTGLVLVALAVRAVTSDLGLGEGLALFAITVVVSVAAGVAAGVAGTAIVRVARLPTIAFAVTIALAYGTYLVSASIGLSGVLATVVTATTMGTLLRRSWSDAVMAHQLDRAWSGVAFLLSAVTFLAIGAAADLGSMRSAAGAIVVGAVAVLAARALLVYLPFAIARPRVPLGWAHVLFWSGLRGAIAFAAALALPVGFPERQLLQDIAFGIVLFTLIAQGVTAPAVVRWALPRHAGAASEE